MLNSNNKSENISSLTVALLVCSQYLSSVFSIYASASEKGFFAPILILIIALMAISYIFNPVTKVTEEYFGIIIIISVSYFLTSSLAKGKSDLAFTEFVGMCFVPMICGGILKPNYRKVMTISMMMLYVSVPVFSSLFAKANTSSVYDAVTMGTSYSILPIIMAGVLHFFFYRKESKIIERITYVVTAIYLVSFIILSYRGALVAAAIVIIFGYICSAKSEQINRRFLLFILVLLIPILLAAISGISVLTWLVNALSKYGINIAFIQKTMYLSSTGSLTHGRFEIWKKALSGFWDSPIFGHGMATFQYYTGIIFPHNLFLQLLYDGGVLLFIPILFALIKGVVRMFSVIRYGNKDKFVFLLLLVGISITRSMVSAEIWRIILLWLLFGILSNDCTDLEDICEADKFEKEFSI